MGGSSLVSESKAEVTNIIAEEGYLLVELDQSIFYPGGGGQPCDLGILESGSFKGHVVEAFRKNGNIIHKVKVIEGTVKEGEEITQKIDRERRVRLTRMHTGEHILFKSLEKSLGEISLTKIDLDEEESSLFITAADATWEKLLHAEELANAVIGEDRQIVE